MAATRCPARPSSRTSEPNPIEDKAHARNAKARATHAVKAGRMSKAEAGKADAVIKKH